MFREAGLVLYRFIILHMRDVSALLWPGSVTRCDGDTEGVTWRHIIKGAAGVAVSWASWDTRAGQLWSVPWHGPGAGVCQLCQSHWPRAHPSPPSDPSHRPHTWTPGHGTSLTEQSRLKLGDLALKVSIMWLKIGYDKANYSNFIFYGGCVTFMSNCILKAERYVKGLIFDNEGS